MIRDGKIGTSGNGIAPMYSQDTLPNSGTGLSWLFSEQRGTPPPADLSRLPELWPEEVE